MYEHDSTLNSVHCPSMNPELPTIPASPRALEVQPAQSGSTVCPSGDVLVQTSSLLTSSPNSDRLISCSWLAVVNVGQSIATIVPSTSRTGAVASCISGVIRCAGEPTSELSHALNDSASSPSGNRRTLHLHCPRRPRTILHRRGYSEHFALSHPRTLHAHRQLTVVFRLF